MIPKTLSYEWRTPDPITDLARPAPSEVLPGILGQLVPSIANSYQAPADLPLLASLAVLSAATRGRVHVEVTTSWREALSLYVAPMLPSGSRKSAVLRELTAPLYALEQEHAKAASSTHLEQQSDRRVAEQRLKAAEDRYAKKQTPNGLADLAAARDALTRCHVEPLPRYLVDDATPEALAAILVEQGSTAALVAEGGLISILSGDRYNNGTANLDVVLKAYDSEPIRIDRRGRESQRADAPHLALCIAAQPDVLREMRDSREMVARGLNSRTLFAVPESLLGQRELDGPAVPVHLAQAWEQIIRQLVENQQRRVLTLDAEGSAALREFRAWCEKLLREYDDDWMQGFISKLPGHIVRIAALFTLSANSHAEVIEAADIRSATGLANWLRWHAQAAGQMRVPTPQQRLLRYLRLRASDTTNGVIGDASLGSAFTTRSVQQALKSQRWVQQGKTQAVRAALESLCDSGWIRPAERPKNAIGRPQEFWEPHPELINHYDSQREHK